MAASALIGLFVGGLVFGYVTDLVGRQAMYTLDVALILVCSVAQFFVTGPVWLLLARFIMGIAIGADYPIATSLLAEFAPREKRAGMLGWLTAMWAAGNAFACIAGDLMTRIGPDGWRWMLASPAVLAGALMLARMGTSESPRWLLSKGRVEEARAALRQALGPHADLADLDEEPARTRLRTVFSGVYLRRMLFVATFWSCSIWPIYAIYAFGPVLLTALHLGDPQQANIGAAILAVVFLAGCIIATLFANRISRRAMLIGPFVISTLALLGLGLFPNATVSLTAALFTIYALAIGGPTIMQWIYPNELFPPRCVPPQSVSPPR